MHMVLPHGGAIWADKTNTHDSLLVSRDFDAVCVTGPIVIWRTVVLLF